MPKCLWSMMRNSVSASDPEPADAACGASSGACSSGARVVTSSCRRAEQCQPKEQEVGSASTARVQRKAPYQNAQFSEDGSRERASEYRPRTRYERHFLASFAERSAQNALFACQILKTNGSERAFIPAQHAIVPLFARSCFPLVALLTCTSLSLTSSHTSFVVSTRSVAFPQLPL